MPKFRSPFNTNELWLTQTYHSGSNNTAIDLSATADTPVYAIADGPVTYRSAGAGSYCIQQIDNSELRVYYVHTYRWVAANTYVKKGQIVCYIAPTSLNGGFPTHLHLGLPLNKYIMNYFDRNLIFRTRFNDIKALWFSGENLDWSKFADLSYENKSMFKIGDVIEFTGEQNIRKGSGTNFEITGTAKPGQAYTIEDGPRMADGYSWYDLVGADWVADVGKMKLYVKPPTPPEPPGQTECEKQVVNLKQEIQGLELELGTLEGIIDDLTTQLEQETENFEESQRQYDTLVSLHNKTVAERNEAIKDLQECKVKLEDSKRDLIRNILSTIEEWLKGVLG